MKTLVSRRRFFQGIAATGAFAALGSRGRPVWGAPDGPNERLNIGIIGTANRAAANLDGVSSQNIVALCDIDDQYLEQAKSKFPAAKTYNDFRKLLDQKDLDAVVVSTADHVHTPASVMAMRRGLHVYCEKPLAHTVHEARLMAETAAKHNVATQMGTQIHAQPNYRRVVEVIRSGAIGPIRECHVWCDKSWSGGERPKETPAVPANLHWDLWIGPAPERPYHSTYIPANWRRWWDFGSGTLGDMACHYMDLPFWALGLRHPTSVEAEGPPVHPETTPPWMIVNYQFPARGESPALPLTWYDGGKRPALFQEPGKLPKWGDGVLFVGENGMLIADYNRYVLLPEARFKDFSPTVQPIPESIGHYAEWIAACKSAQPTTCNFDYSGALTEAVLLGNVAYRTGKRLDWDSRNLKARNCPEADQYVRTEYRKGWTL